MDTSPSPNPRQYPERWRGRPRGPASELSNEGLPPGYVRVGVRLIRRLDALLEDSARRHIRPERFEVEALLTAWVERARARTVPSTPLPDRDRRQRRLRLPLALVEEIDGYAATAGLSRERMVEAALLEQLEGKGR